MIVTVGATKGGTGKSTSAVALAVQLAWRGPTVLVDADAETATVTTWWARAQRRGYTWPESLSLVEWREPMSLPPMAHVVIDTGPGDRATLTAALRLSDTALIPIKAEDADVAQVGTTAALVEKVAAERAMTWGVLLTRVKLGTREAIEAPRAIDADGYPRLDTVVTDGRMYARMFGTVPTWFGAYGDVLRELEG